MACSCNRGQNGVRNINRTNGVIRPANTQSNVPPTALRSAVPTPERSLTGDFQEKQKTQKIRREAIRRALNK